MATLNKFNAFLEDFAEKVHNMGSDAHKFLLTNTVPNAADVTVDTVTGTCTVEATSNAPEIAAGSGYTKGGIAPTITSSAQSGGVYKLVLADATWTASGGTIGPFRYIVWYNDTGGAAATRPAVGWYDYGSAITLNDGETFTLDFDPTNGVLQGTLT